MKRQYLTKGMLKIEVDHSREVNMAEQDFIDIEVSQEEMEMEIEMETDPDQDHQDRKVIW